MSLDYYTEARAVIDELFRDGFVLEATKIREAMETGSTASEILMAIRWHLQQFQKANNPVSFDTRRKIRELVAELNKVLA